MSPMETGFQKSWKTSGYNNSKNKRFFRSLNPFLVEAFSEWSSKLLKLATEKSVTRRH